MAPPLSLYVHLPWCAKKCPYCDFNSHRGGDPESRTRYLAALARDLEAEAGRGRGRSIATVFIGGGTPSLFTPAEIGAVIEDCDRHLSLDGGVEITMEANPGTVERGSLAGYRAAGVTRLSLGAQSFDARLLHALGRIHGPDEITAAWAEARDAGFDSINVDLMFALPGQDLAGARRDIDRLLALSPPHVSYYQLTLEPNTVFHRRPPANLPDDELAWDIQSMGHERLASAGYEHYEISAFARPGHRCRHNLNYWLFGDYLAVGAGAHGKWTDDAGAVWRYRKPPNPLAYMEAMERRGDDTAGERVAAADLPFEFMLNAARLVDGFPLALFNERTDAQADALKPTLDRAIADGLLEEPSPGHVRPTDRGLRFLNDLQARFLAD